MKRIFTLDDVIVKDKVLLVRVDFNSPVDPKTRKLMDDARIKAHAETTINDLIHKGAKIVILAHQGRQGDADFIPLEQHAESLGRILGMKVKYVNDLYGEKARTTIKNLRRGEVLVLENVRDFAAETNKAKAEEHAKTELIKNLAPLADLFVSDAFAAAHRSHASIVGFTAVLPSVAGRIMERELKSLSRVGENPEKPCVYVLGGAKGDDSLKISKYVLDNEIADYVLTGGVTGQLFLASKGVDLGKPNMKYLEENKLMIFTSGIKELIEKYPEKIKVPVDVAINFEGKRKDTLVGDLPTDYPMMDIGARTAEKYGQIVRKSKSIVLSGPMGVYENDEFALGTRKVFSEIANSKAFSLAGGGHTIAAVDKFGLKNKISYISTAGGALIEFLMGEKLPGIVALEQAASKMKK